MNKSSNAMSLMGHKVKKNPGISGAPSSNTCHETKSSYQYRVGGSGVIPFYSRYSRQGIFEGV